MSLPFDFFYDEKFPLVEHAREGRFRPGGQGQAGGCLVEKMPGDDYQRGDLLGAAHVVEDLGPVEAGRVVVGRLEDGIAHGDQEERLEFFVE